MILKLRTSKTFKISCVVLAFNIFFELVLPRQSFALTGGPAQPEFNSFTPIGTSDMVDLSSGDMTYNIPLMDVGGYPLNMAYSAGVGMDQEASWVGLGWNLSVGQINRNVRGLPDDFDGDIMTYENYTKPNITVGASFKLTPGLMGVPTELDFEGTPITESEFSPGNLTFGISAMYNNYSGFSLKPSVGITADLGKNLSVGATVESGADGLNVSPNISIHQKNKNNQRRAHTLGASVGVSMNSRQGLTSTTLSASRSSTVRNNTNKNHPDKGRVVGGGPNVGSTIGYTDQVYTPQKRVGMSSGTFTFNAALGAEIFGGEASGQITAYGTISKVKESEKSKDVAAYGYCNTQSADKYSILDFNREKDGAFTTNSTNLPITNYTYDIYSVQGQGVSGTFRPYRNQVGFVYDPYVSDGSFSGSLGLEFGTGNAFHLGIDVEASFVKSHSGVWEDANQILQHLTEGDDYDPNFESYHMQNVGDLSVDKDFGMFHLQGRYQPIRVPFVGSKFNKTAESKLRKKYDGAGNENVIPITGAVKRAQRKLRNQAIYNLSKADVDAGMGLGPLSTNPGQYSLPGAAKAHHTAEIQIIRNDGARYVYGLGAYNIEKKETSFDVTEVGNCATGLVGYEPNDLLNPKDNLKNDKYFNRVTTPGYVHTHLLTSVLSADYQDIDGNGPTDDDLGSYTKFSYVRKNANYKWRIPFEENMASLNEGMKTDSKDDRGNYVYGEKEQYYVDQIETKTHVAVFHYSTRKDAFGVKDEGGGLGATQYSYKLDKISLYSIEEYDGLGIYSASTPIKEVNFQYSYSLCTGVPNNELQGGGAPTALSPNELSNLGGKLTLKKVYFTYRNSSMGKYTGYKFNYGEYAPLADGSGGFYNPDEFSSGAPALNLNTTYSSGQPLSGLNPLYNIKAYDYWGNYKPNTTGCGNTDPISAAEYPYTEQDQDIQNNRSAVWSLNKISLPSGGAISINYESDDYGFVQDKEVMKMYKIAGTGTSPSGSASDVNPATKGADLFGTGIWNNVNQYIYVQVDDNAVAGDIDQYMKGFPKDPIYFRCLVNTTMLGGQPAGQSNGKFDYVSGYFEYNPAETQGDCNIFTQNSKQYLSIPVKLVEKEGGLIPGGLVHPISKASWQFCSSYLSKHSYSNQVNGDSEDIASIVTDLLTPQMLTNLIEVFNGPNATLENKNVARRIIKEKSWIRLNTKDVKKLGGGCRVKEIRMSDVWEDMNPGQGSYQTMSYGQKYEYEIENNNENIENKTSGVATYEPIGNKENPFVQPVASTTAHLLAPDEYNYVEMPFGESFFPSPQITYSRVSVSNLAEGEAPVAGQVVKRLHRTGSVVTEFYTSKDYPTIVDQTKLQAEEDDKKILHSILKLNVKKHFTASQGYVIHCNDMNAKEKAKRVYAEGQSEAISGADYLYDGYSTDPLYTAASYADGNKGRLNNLVRVINPNGTIEEKHIGVESDVVHDFRENRTKTKVPGVNGNLATFFVGIIPGIVPMLLPDYSQSEDQFRSVGTTKVINTFGILKETIAYDAGSTVYTRNLAWDASTGEVLVTETIDEYNDKYYTINYPAHWYYKGMGQAALNLGLEGTLANVGSGVYQMSSISPYQSSDFLIEADKLYLSGSDKMAWVSKVIGNNFELIDEDGNLLTGESGKFEVVRSGHRNLQSAGIMNVTLMQNPLQNSQGGNLNSISPTYLSSQNWVDWRIINAGAVDYSDDWKVDCECGFTTDGPYNPYIRNEKGVWRTKSSRTYLTGRNFQADVTPRREGFFTDFKPMYRQIPGGHWYKDFTDWTYVAEVTKYSPYGFELENKDALNRYSAAQYGYNNTFPMAVGANSEYRQIGFDGFEDYGFAGCAVNAHFNFKELINVNTQISENEWHTGKKSIIVGALSAITLNKTVGCE